MIIVTVIGAAISTLGLVASGSGNERRGADFALCAYLLVPLFGPSLSCCAWRGLLESAREGQDTGQPLALSWM